MSAKYYLYRNLHTGGFSVKQRGRVVGRGETILMKYVEFRVSEAGRNRAVSSQQRNVHAYAVADNYKVAYPDNDLQLSDKFREVTYNPFKDNSFVYVDTGMPIFMAALIATKNGKLYAR